MKSKSPGSRTDRRCSSSHTSSNAMKSNIDIKSNSTIGRRRKRNEALMIDLDVAKRIVEHACINAACAKSLDGAGRPNLHSVTVSAGEDTDDTDCNSLAKTEIETEIETETEFTDFVSSVIARTMASILANANSNSQSQPQPNSPPKQSEHQKRSGVGRPRKRSRQLESKVEGLEHAESLHTMCSLFPVVLATVESSPDPSVVVMPNPTSISMSMSMPMSMKTATSTIDMNPSASEDGAGESEDNSSHHSDHSSLLPPLGEETTPTRAATNDRRACREKDVAASVSVSASASTKSMTPTPLKHHRAARVPPSSSPPPETAENTKALTATTLLALEQTQTPPNHRYRLHSRLNGRLAHNNNNDNVDDDDDDDDDECGYDRPLIGVAGDDSSDGDGGKDQDQHPYHFTNNGDSSDSIIRLTKVGSIVRIRTPPYKTGNLRQTQEGTLVE